MDNNIINIYETDITPGIVINNNIHSVKISGKSILEDVNEFYIDIINILKNCKIVVMEFYLEEINKESINLLEYLIISTNPIKVIWYYVNEDNIYNIGKNIYEIIKTEKLNIKFVECPYVNK